MDKRQIWYEPHPVSAERKAELRGQGYIIVDAVFAPEGYADDKPKAEPKAEPKAKALRGRNISPAEADGAQ